MIIYDRHDLEDMNYEDSLLAEIDTLAYLGAIGPDDAVQALREWIVSDGFDSGCFEQELWGLLIGDDLIWMRVGPSLWVTDDWADIDQLNYCLG